LQSAPASHALRTPADCGSDSAPGSQQCTHAAPSTIVQSEELLKGQRALEIRHNGMLYRLQATKLGKLILTK
jgi:hemin uptake protein HemP